MTDANAEGDPDSNQSRQRMRAKHRLDTANVHAQNKEWGLARTEYEAVLKLCSADNWSMLTCGIHLQLMKCCEQLQDTQSWFEYCLEYLTNTTASLDDRLKHHQRLVEYVTQSTTTTTTLYTTLPPLKKPIVKPMAMDDNFISLTTQFSSVQCTVHNEVQFTVNFDSTKCPTNLKFDKLNVTFNLPKYDISTTQQQTEEKQTCIVLSNTQPTLFTFPLTIQEEGLIFFKKVELQVGDCGESSESGLSLVWEHETDDDETMIKKAKEYSFAQAVRVNSTFLSRPLMLVSKVTPKVTVELTHTPPALLNEHYALTLLISSNDHHVLEGVISVPYLSDVNIGLEGEPTNTTETNEGTTTFSFPAIAPQCHHEVKVVLQGTRPGLHTIPWTITYDSTLSTELEVTTPLELPVVYPFDIQFDFSEVLLWSLPPTASNQHTSTFLYKLACGGKLLQSTNTFKDDDNKKGDEKGSGTKDGNMSMLLANKSSSQFPSMSIEPDSASFGTSASNFPTTTIAPTTEYSTIQFKPLPLSDEPKLGNKKEEVVTPPTSSSSDYKMLTFRTNQLVCMATKLIATAPFPISIHDIHLTTLHGVSLWNDEPQHHHVGDDGVDTTTASPLLDTLDNQEEYEQHFTLKINQDDQQPQQQQQGGDTITGLVRVTASRGIDGKPVVFELPVPTLTVVYCPINLTVSAPINVYLGTEIVLKVTLQNTSTTMQVVNVTFHDCRSFFWSGRAQVAYDLLPNQTIKLSYNLVPIQSGANNLPSFDISVNGVSLVTPQEHWMVHVHPQNENKTSSRLHYKAREPL